MSNLDKYRAANKGKINKGAESRKKVSLERHKAVADLWLDGYTGSDAYKMVYKSNRVRMPNSEAASASIILHKPEILEYIREQRLKRSLEALDSQGVKVDQEENLRWWREIRDGKVKGAGVSLRLNASEKLGRATGQFLDRSEVLNTLKGQMKIIIKTEDGTDKC
jgi:hypothetical protein